VLVVDVSLWFTAGLEVLLVIEAPEEAVVGSVVS
jgi:hypothetical protein